jgi:hypothetical protein
MPEYRTLLTADLVTGKLDMREAAARLPEPPAEPAATLVEPLEELEPEDADARAIGILAPARREHPSTAGAAHSGKDRF